MVKGKREREKKVGWAGCPPQNLGEVAGACRSTWRKSNCTFGCTQPVSGLTGLGAQGLPQAGLGLPWVSAQRQGLGQSWRETCRVVLTVAGSYKQGMIFSERNSRKAKRVSSGLRQVLGELLQSALITNCFNLWELEPVLCRRSECPRGSSLGQGGHITETMIRPAVQYMQAPGSARVGKVKGQHSSYSLPGSFRARGDLYQGNTQALMQRP